MAGATGWRAQARADRIRAPLRRSGAPWGGCGEAHAGDDAKLQSALTRAHQGEEVAHVRVGHLRLEGHAAGAQPCWGCEAEGTEGAAGRRGVGQDEDGAGAPAHVSRTVRHAASARSARSSTPRCGKKFDSERYACCGARVGRGAWGLGTEGGCGTQAGRA